MQYWIGVLTIVGIYMIAVLGVSILCGFTGMFSMGHAGFMAIGGYVSALLTKNCGMPIFMGILFRPSGLMGTSELSWRGIKNGVRKLGAALKRRTDARKGGR